MLLYRWRLLFQVVGISFTNLVIIIASYKQYKHNHDWYLHLPLDQQKEIYNRCSEQYISSSGDALSSAGHRFFMDNPSLLSGQRPFVPYEASLNKRIKNTNLTYPRKEDCAREPELIGGPPR